MSEEPKKDEENSKMDVKKEGEQPDQKDTDTAANFTEEQMKRTILCRSFDDKLIEVPYHLLMQSRTFSNMWMSLGAEEKYCPDADAKDLVLFPLNDITSECFQQIIAWMREHHGQPEAVITTNDIGERIWFKFTEWETAFFDVDFEKLKEYYLAANFLDIKTLFYYCAQECARCVMNQEPEEIRRMLCLPDDLTADERAAIRREFVEPNTNQRQPAGGEAEEDDPDRPGPSGLQNIRPQQPTTNSAGPGSNASSSGVSSGSGAVPSNSEKAATDDTFSDDDLDSLF